MARKSQVERVLKRYSNFVSFPVLLDGDRVNTVQALWCGGRGAWGSACAPAGTSPPPRIPLRLLSPRRLLRPLRAMQPREVSDEAHADFYKFISGDNAAPSFRLHFTCACAPVFPPRSREDATML